MTKKFERREARILSDHDVAAIAKAINTHHEGCRFIDIKAEDLRAMVESHKKFNVAMDDSKTVARRFFLILVLTAISGYAIYGYWAKIGDHIKKAIAN